MSYTVEARRILLIYSVLGHNAMPTYGKDRVYSMKVLIYWIH